MVTLTARAYGTGGRNDETMMDEAVQRQEKTGQDWDEKDGGDGGRGGKDGPEDLWILLWTLWSIYVIC